MKTKQVTFIVKFEEVQDTEVDCNALNETYLALDRLQMEGLIADYNCSEMAEACDTEKEGDASTTKL